MATRWIVVVKDRRRTSAEPSVIYLGSDSSHALGTEAASSVYTSRSNVQASSSSGRKVTDAVIWRIIAAISDWISLWLFVRTTLQIHTPSRGSNAAGGHVAQVR